MISSIGFLRDKAHRPSGLIPYHEPRFVQLPRPEAALYPFFMNRQEAVEALELLRKVVSQARDDTTLQNWGVIWMVHGVVNAGAFTATNFLMWRGYESPWPYVALWSAVLLFNIPSIFLLKSRTAGARTFVENMIWLIWTTFIGTVALTGLANHLSGFKVFTLGPVIGILSTFGFSMMGGLMGKKWFLLAAVFALASLVMAVLPDWQFVILGSVWGISQFAAGFLMDRARRRRLAILASPQARLV
jgi:hypothetical protein